MCFRKQKWPGLSTRPFKTHQCQSSLRNAAPPQPAFCSGAAAATFFSIARLRSSARGERLAARAFRMKVSKPPLWSTLLMALVETRRRTLRPSASEMKVTLHRFGRNRRLVLILEWLTLWPTWGPLAVSSQRRDISKNPLPSLIFRPAGGRNRGSNRVHPGSGGRIEGKAGGVKVLTARVRFPQAPESPPMAGFRGRSSASRHHINGVFTTDISGIAGFRRLRRISDEPAPVFALFAGYYWVMTLQTRATRGRIPGDHIRHDIAAARPGASLAARPFRRGSVAGRARVDAGFAAGGVRARPAGRAI